MKILLATDSFKGCLTSEEVEAALAVCIDRIGAEAICMPMSDGGDGMLSAFASAMKARLVGTLVHDPLMRPIVAQYAIAPDGTAIVETAQACGLHLLRDDEHNPMLASTFGVGEIIIDAIDRGCRRFLIGLGGSGTSDCGRGMLSALATHYTGGDMALLASLPLLKSCAFTLASDVRNPLFGHDGAAYVFALQKGATPEMQKELDRMAQDFAQFSSHLLGHDMSRVPGAGAAGGLGYAMMQYMGAQAMPGADILLRETHFQDVVRQADLVITGEGSADKQTLMGKLPQRILQQVRQAGDIPVWLVAGQVHDHEELVQAGFSRVDSINPDGFPLAEAMLPHVARLHLTQWADDALRTLAL